MSLKVTIDTREQKRIKSATKYYQGQGLAVNVEELPIGDYIFSDGTNEVVFEFKTISDFVSSIQNGKIFNQAINQAERFDYHYVIIQGDEATRAKALGMSRNWRTVTIFQYLGAIASLNRFTTVIESYNTYIEESYYRMLIAAKKSLLDKPIVKKFPRKNKNPAMNYLTYCVYGLNHKRAHDITTKLDLHTLEDLLHLDHKKLTSINGIGDKLADRILNTITEETYES